MAGFVSSRGGAEARPHVLLLTDDTHLTAARITRHLALALKRLGYHAVVRDTRLIRWGAAAAADCPARREAFEVAAVAKWAKLVEDYGIGLVLGLDLHWLVSRHLFINDSNVRQVHTFWTGAVPVPLPGAPTFPLDARERIANAKVTHHCSSAGQAEALSRLGIGKVRPSPLAAPAEYLRVETPCEVRDRLAFVGEPAPAVVATVVRLAQRGLLDVYGDTEAWKAAGVAARPAPLFPRLPELYRRYPALLNFGAGESLFEIAACGRLSLSLDDPEIRACFGEDEASLAAGEDALELAAEKILRDPDSALAAGAKARLRTAREHLWENRLEAALA